MLWKEVQIETTLEAEEAVVNAFYEAGANGVAIQNLQDAILVQQDPRVNYMDESLLKLEPGVSIIQGYFSEAEDTEEALHKLFTAIKRLPSYGIDPGECAIQITDIDEEYWANSWKKYHKPIKIGDRIVIKPTWEAYEQADDELVIHLDPGMAFGTGSHETTRLCVCKLEKYIQPGDCVLDIGCGSGVLSLVAGKLGAKRAVGVDFDPLAVQVAKENATLNHLDEVMEIREGHLLDVIDEEADVIVANILAAAIVELTGAVKPFLKEGGLFISSGIILDRLVDVLQALENEHFKLVELKQQGEWVVVVARKQD